VKRWASSGELFLKGEEEKQEKKEEKKDSKCS